LHAWLRRAASSAKKGHIAPPHESRSAACTWLATSTSAKSKCSGTRHVCAACPPAGLLQAGPASHPPAAVTERPERAHCPIIARHEKSLLLAPRASTSKCKQRCCLLLALGDAVCRRAESCSVSTSVAGLLNAPAVRKRAYCPARKSLADATSTSKCKERTEPLFVTVHPRSIPRRLVPLQAAALGRYSSGVTRLLGAQGRVLGTTEPGFVRCPFA
jgi:hypothetical protein